MIIGSGYQTLADNLLAAFNKIGCLPKTIDLSKLDDGEGFQATFEHRRAMWHDSCRLEYNKTKLYRVATPGTADSFIKDAHVTRSRWAHQVTASVLYLLRQKCYTLYCDELDEGQVTVSAEDGCATRADTSPRSRSGRLSLSWNWKS